MLQKYISKITVEQAEGKNIEVGQKICTEFFEVSPSIMQKSQDFRLNINLKKNSEDLHEISILTTPPFCFDSRLNSALQNHGYEIHPGDLLVFDKVGLVYCLTVIQQGDALHDALLSFFDGADRELLLSIGKKKNLIDAVFFQKIFYGAPGTGKSHKIDYNLFEENGFLIGKGLKNSDLKDDQVWRTTFHPDYDYAQFVGAYKPKKDGTSITYAFVPQVFAKAYVAAWKKFFSAGLKSAEDNQIYLVIEEINRGNCAQIFGDIFQLLDRKDGWSEYPIDVDNDFATYIRDEIKKLGKFAEYRKVICDCMEDSAEIRTLSDDEFCKIALPPNFNILATMNTSDQSLFPMDSAFKRRFDWQYVPIRYKNPYCEGSEEYEKWGAHKFKINLGLKENNPLWLSFLERINDNIRKVDGNCEDKQMGEFFLKPADGENIDLEMFKSKVLFYLWDTIYKDCDNSDENVRKVFFFEEQLYDEKEQFTFQSLFRHDDDGKRIVAQIMDNLMVAPLYEKNDGKWGPKNNGETYLKIVNEKFPRKA